MTKTQWIFGILLAGTLAATLPAIAQSGAPAQTVVTVVPKSGTQAPPVAREQLQVSLNNKSSQITDWVQLRGEHAGLQLVILIDNSARAGLSLQYADLKNFIQHLPEGAEVGLAYMQNGSAIMAQNLTPDHKLAADALRLPSGPAGSSGGPYFCLSSLVKNWPSGNTPGDTGVRREVLMITDGVDLYNGRRYDPSDPYVAAAILDAQRAGVLVHSIFYKNVGRAESGEFTQSGGQNYLIQVAAGTGGKAYWQGFGNPVSFVPFLDDLQTRLANQYELGILAAKPGNKTALQPLKVKTTAPGIKIDAPSSIVVPGSESASR
jgi:hypothetical protein